MPATPCAETFLHPQPRSPVFFGFVLPLLAAIIYTLGSLFSKRGFQEGAGGMQGFHVSCLLISLTPLPLILLEKQAVAWHNTHQVLLCGGLLYLGNWLALLGVHRGDVSIVTPVLGTKVVFVAVGTVTLIGIRVPWSLWVAALLTPVGILVLGAKSLHLGRQFWRTIGYALSSAASFALFDVLMNKWALAFGPFAFISLSSIVMAIPASAALVRRPVLWHTLSGPSRFWLLLGGFAMGFQASLLGIALAFSEQATRVNVVYASRGLWAIIFVWILGHSLRLQEKHQGSDVFAWRLAGAGILTLAIVLAIFSKA